MTTKGKYFKLVWCASIGALHQLFIRDALKVLNGVYNIGKSTAHPKVEIVHIGLGFAFLF